MTGKTILHYRILSELGRGGMGVVYKAEDTKLKRLVAIKFLPRQIAASDDERERFKIEAQAAAALNHPNIATIYAIAEHKDEIFIVMEYIEGHELKTLAKVQNLRKVLDYATQIASGLQAAHAKGITHRDIKSSNIMVTQSGQVKIMDFGLAKIAGGAQPTKDHSTLGTAAYMSPEQARSGPVDHRSDIWSFGVVLYEMLTGQLPFRGDYEQAVIYSILNEEPEALQEAPAALKQIVSKALAKKPEERYQEAQEVLVDLKSVNSERASTGQDKSARADAMEAPLSRNIVIAGISALLILIIATLVFFRPTPEAGSKLDAIAVLPLANLSGDPKQEYFADGMTEALISVLGQIEALHVISRTSVMQYKGGTKPLPAIARELNVDAVVEGSVQSSGNRVNISVRLIAGETEKRLWSDSFEREMRDVLTLQREVGLAIAQEIKAQVTANERARLQQGREVDPEVYDLYLLGRKFREQESSESLQQAIAYFEQAIAKDPNFAPAYAEVAVPYFLLEVSTRSKGRYESKARQAATKAVELDNTLPEAHAALGVIRQFFDWDWPGAEEAFRRAIALNPSNTVAHRAYGQFLCRTGRKEAGLAEMKRAYALDPFLELTNCLVAWVYIHNRRYNAAIEQCQKTLTFYPNSAYAYLLLGEAYLPKREYATAIGALENEVASTIWVNHRLGFLGCAYALSGNRNKVLELLEKLQLQQKPGIDATVPFAFIYTGLGENEQALTWLEQAYEAHSPPLTHYISDPIFDSLHSEPRFQAILKEMGLER